MISRLISILAVLVAVATPAAAFVTEDPLNSPIWEDLNAAYLSDGTTVYDGYLRIVMPERIEDSANVPIVVTLSPFLGEVEALMVFAENNPIQAVARIELKRAIRSVGFNMRLEQSTPVRAAALDSNGVWHVASLEVIVLSPGGCTAPLDDGAGDNLGEIAMTRFDRVVGSRLKIRINHPMHTGFALDDNDEPIDAYFIDTVKLTDDAGTIAEMTTWAAVSSNPTFILDLPDNRQNVRINATDSEGLAFEWLEKPPAM